MRRLTTIIFAIVSCVSLHGQSNPYGNGIIPYRAYDYSKVGVVDLKTRHMTLNIPLLSFKQKGSLPDLSVSFVYNSSRWESYRPDEPSGNETYYWLPYIANSTAAVTLGIPSSPVTGRLETGVGGMYAPSPLTVPVGDSFASYIYVSSINGPTSLVGTDSGGSGITLDGTGIAATSDATSTKVTAKNGVTYNLRYCTESTASGYCSQVAGYIKDSSGNQVTLNYPSGSTGIPTSFTDSIGRTFNYFSTVSTAGHYPNYYPTNSTTSLEVRQSAHAVSSDLPNIGGYVIQYSGTWVLIDSIILPNETQWGFHYNAYGDISQIDLPTGGTISFTWDSVPDPDDQTSYDRVVTSRTESDGTNSYTWHYADQHSQWPGVTGSAIVVTDPNNNDTAYIAGGPCVRDLEVNYFQGSFSLPSYGGSPCTPSAANLLKSEYTTYLGSASGAFSPGSGYGVQLPVEKVSTWPNGQTLVTDYTYDTSLTWTDPNYQGTGVTPTTESYSTGSVKSVKEYDYGTSGAGALVRQTITGYKWEEPSSPYLTANLLSIPSSVVVQDGAGNPVTEKDYAYDESSYSDVSQKAGLNTTLSTGLTGQQVTTHTYFNSDGMTRGNKDGRNSVSSISYECGGLVPHQLTNPLSQTTTLGCDLNTGNVTSVQDSNGANTGYTYTSVNDPSVITFPDTGSITYDYHGYAPPLHVTSTQTATPDPSIVTDTYFDGLGRATKVVRAGTEIDTQYDGLGQVKSVSNPSDVSPTQYTTYSYDALGRKLLQCNPDNGTGNGSCSPGASYLQWSYNSNLVTFYDENRNTWQRTMDGLGRLTGVVEPNQTNTAYSYYALGDLKSVTQSGVATDTPRTRSFTYDSLSRLLTASNPETGIICYGTRSGSSCVNGYDANGNLTSKTDARGAVSNYHYDALNRLYQKDYSSIAGANSTYPTLSTCYFYDSDNSSGTNKVGRLVAEWTQPGDCPSTSSSMPANVVSWKNSMSYDAMGRLTGESQCALVPCTSPNPVPSTLQYTYDLAGNLTYTNNGLPNSQSPQVGWNNFYDGAGRLKQVVSNWADATHADTLFQADATVAGALNVSGGAYSPFGSLMAAWYGVNSAAHTVALSDTRSYDNRARLVSKAVLGGTSSTSSLTPTTTTLSFNPSAFATSEHPPVSAQVSCNTACGQIALLLDGNPWIPPSDLGSDGNLPSGWRTDSWAIPSVGTHTVTANYLGNGTYAPSSGSTQIIVNPVGSQPTTLSLTLAPLTFATVEDAIANVHVGCNTSCGRVQFTVDGNFWVGWNLDGNGDVSADSYWWLVPGIFTLGNHTLTATYQGSSTYAPISQSQNFTVSPVGSQQTTISLSVSPSTTLSPADDYDIEVHVGCNTNCGIVQLLSDGQLLWQGSLDSSGGIGFLKQWDGPLPQGAHALTANYLGSATYASQSASTNITVGSTLTTTTLTFNPSAFATSELPQISAHVSCNTACGQVALLLDGNPWVPPYDLESDGNMPSWWSTDTWAIPSVGTHTVTASYLGNGAYAPSSSSIQITVNPVGLQSTTLSLTLDPLNFAPVEDAVANVHVGCNTSCGRVQFNVDGNPWIASNLDGNGSTSLDTYWWADSGLFTQGNHILTATYQGNSTYAPISQSQNFTVSPVGSQQTTISLSVSPSTTLSLADDYDIEVHVGCNTNCGLVQLLSDGQPLWLGSLDSSGGIGFLKQWNGPLPQGAHTLTANYLGSATYAAQSASTNITINP
jgi:YD repeat-containing protein